MDTPFDRNILAMSDFRADSGYGAIAQVESYWEGLRGNRLMPKRSEIDPRGIEMALEYCFVVERIAPGIARLRIAGSHLGDLMGMEVRGMPLTSFFTPQGRAEVGNMLEDVFQRPAVAELNLRGESGFGRPELEARMVLLPLKSDLGDVSRALGCLVSQGRIGNRPRRFEIAKSSLRSIVSPATLPERHDDVEEATLVRNVPSHAPKVVSTGMSESAPIFKHRAKAGAKGQDVPYLRLVKSDK